MLKFGQIRFISLLVASHFMTRAPHSNRSKIHNRDLCSLSGERPEIYDAAKFSTAFIRLRGTMARKVSIELSRARRLFFSRLHDCGCAEYNERPDDFLLDNIQLFNCNDCVISNSSIRISLTRVLFSHFHFSLSLSLSLFLPPWISLFSSVRWQLWRRKDSRPSLGRINYSLFTDGSSGRNGG